MFKTNKGFTSLLNVFFVLLLSLSIFCYGFIFNAQNKNDFAKKICFIDIVNLQKNIAKSETSLFQLNPLSTALRTQLKLLKIALVAAIATKNAILADQIQWQINLTINKQNALHGIQKAIISQAKLQLMSDLATLDKKINEQFNKETFVWKTYLDLKNNHYRNTPVIAVQPDPEAGLAPNYELSRKYKSLQKLDLVLLNQFSSKDSAQTTLKTRQSYEFNCHAYYEKQGEQWDLIITTDKYLSRL